MNKNEEHETKIDETAKINAEYEEKFGDKNKGKYDENDKTAFVLKYMAGNHLYLFDIHKEEHERRLRTILDDRFNRTSIVIDNNSIIDSGVYTKWETPWDFDIMYGEGDIDCWVIKYSDTILHGRGKDDFAFLGNYMYAIPRIISQMETDPKKLITKSASVIVLERELNMTAKLHHHFGCWYLLPNGDNCPIRGMHNDPFNITISNYTIDEWTFNVLYNDDKNDKDFGQSISDIFKRIYS